MTFIEFLFEAIDDDVDPATQGDVNKKIPKRVSDMKTRAALMNARARKRVAISDKDPLEAKIATQDEKRARLVKRRDDFARREQEKSGL